MPFRPKKKVRLGKRPAWNTESDYYLRERRRLQLIETINEDCGNLRKLPYVCPGCDHPIWEARKDDLIFRGCHCLTLMLPPSHRLYEFDPEAWVEAVRTSGQTLQMTSAPPDQGRACVRTLTRIHPSISADPFSILKGALVSVPNGLGYACTSCGKPVRRGFTPAQLTGFEFSFTACSCTGLSQFANLGDPSVEQWAEIVAEAAELAPGRIKIHTKVMVETPDAGGPS